MFAKFNLKPIILNLRHIGFGLLNIFLVQGFEKFIFYALSINMLALNNENNTKNLLQGNEIFLL